MYEVEVKVPASHEAVRARLDELDAERLSRVRQVDTYYSAPHRDFAETDEALRIRRETRAEGDEGETETGATETGATDDRTATGEGAADDETTVRVTYKGPRVDEQSKTRTEHETAVADPDSAEGILDGLGFEPAATVEKHRVFFRLDGYTVTLDEVDGLGEFVEVETETDDDVDAAREGAFAVLRRLGLDPDDQIRRSYLGLLLSGSEPNSSE